jgi:hypothetical protein
LCLHVCSAGISTCFQPFDQEFALSKFSVSCVSVFGLEGL